MVSLVICLIILIQLGIYVYNAYRMCKKMKVFEENESSDETNIDNKGESAIVKKSLKSVVKSRKKNK